MKTRENLFRICVFYEIWMSTLISVVQPIQFTCLKQTLTTAKPVIGAQFAVGRRRDRRRRRQGMIPPRLALRIPIVRFWRRLAFGIQEIIRLGKQVLLLEHP